MYQTFSVYSFAKNGYPYAAAETKRFLMTCSNKTMWVGILKKNCDSDLHYFDFSISCCIFAQRKIK